MKRKKHELSNGITVSKNGKTATVKCGDKLVKVRYEDESTPRQTTKSI